jgi:hypothetical protein
MEKTTHTPRGSTLDRRTVEEVTTTAWSVRAKIALGFLSFATTVAVNQTGPWAVALVLVTGAVLLALVGRRRG